MNVSPPQPQVLDSAAPAPVKRRPRHFPRPGKLLYIAFLRLLGAAAIIGFGWAFVQVMLTRDQLHGYVAIGLLALFGLCRAVAFVEAQQLRCSLCHGTVAHEKACHKHRDSRRYPLIGYTWSMIIDLIFRRTFHCMYCGTHFRLRK